ncbi:helix-turn-helix domain-containing protein [Paratractidigestivibacter sp.]|uniref:winged helix-turn-helix transcriptional regulator n=1 Tax=Paratractidigestivibacter sp. TaxID=2847316 RepID=UPI002ABE064D|nr:helix-turn-helix domain-containing protein [Paratractidigestivibacter sp.]
MTKATPQATTKPQLPACPVETTLTLIGDKWRVLILRDLMEGTKRFGELRRSVGNVSQKVLTAKLRAMEESGLVHREVYAEVPPRVEYSLTELGRSLAPILKSLREWGEDYKRKYGSQGASVRATAASRSAE